MTPKYTPEPLPNDSFLEPGSHLEPFAPSGSQITPKFHFSSSPNETHLDPYVNPEAQQNPQKSLKNAQKMLIRKTMGKSQESEPSQTLKTSVLLQ